MSKVNKPDYSALGEAGKCHAYLEAADQLFKNNRSDQYNYIVNLDIETGPLLLICGHASELAFKSVLKCHGTSDHSLRKFKGFKYSDTNRKANNSYKRHNLCFLYRAVSILCMSQEDRDRLEMAIRTHTYHREKHEIFLESPERPDLKVYSAALRTLDSAFDTPFRARYFLEGHLQIPDPEIIMVAARFILELASFKRNRIGNTDQDTPQKRNSS